MSSRDQLGRSLNLSEDLIPRSNRNRPGTRINPRYITIHNTDNANRGADARAHARYVKGADAQARGVSWHYTVDDKRCIKHLPLNEKGWHAGGRGNSRSIAIEICMNQGINQAEADRRAATLTAVLMSDLQIPLSRVVTHHHWTRKNCPRLLRGSSNGLDWDQFIDEVSDIFDSIDGPSSYTEREKLEDMDDYDDEDLAEIFPAGDQDFEAWIDAHAQDAEQDEPPAFCSLPEVAERKLDDDIDPPRESMFRIVEKKWVNQTVLRYHFLDTPSHWKGSETQKDAVRQAFETWKSIGIGLEFREVADRGEAEIRIGFEQNNKSESYVGRDAIDVVPDPDQRTMNFGWDLTTPHGRDTALHEIGHALGFPHEHQNPNAGIVWDEEAVYESFAGSPNYWKRPKTKRNVLRQFSAADVEGSNWDPDSIMHYQFNAGLILQPEKYRTEPLIPARGASRLSDQDIAQVKRFYPNTSPAQSELQPFRSAVVNIGPGEQLDFVIRPERTRDYTVQTIGELDTVLVLFEDVDGPRYLDGDDDGGYERNARIKAHLIKGRTYYVRMRLYYARRSGDGAILLW